MEKLCPRCRKLKPLGDFYVNKSRGIYSHCKTCHNLITKEWSIKNRKLHNSINIEGVKRSRKKFLKGRLVVSLPRQKKCNQCGIVKHKSSFGIRSCGRYLRSYCRECENKKNGSFLTINTGLTEDQYDEILKSQGGLCAICKSRSSKTLCVDHCHKLNVVRGLLCNNCNIGLGSFKDNKDSLSSAIEYLSEKSHKYKYAPRRKK